MIEVFKTNINDRLDAASIVSGIQQRFVLLEANFDLQDCDRIMRVKSLFGEINPQEIIALLSSYGFQAEVLPDEISVEDHNFIETTLR
jgi:hypothetical protein